MDPPGEMAAPWLLQFTLQWAPRTLRDLQVSFSVPQIHEYANKEKAKNYQVIKGSF